MFNTWTSKGKYPREKECIAKDYFDEKKYYMGEEVRNEEKFCSLERKNLEQDVKILSESFDAIKKVDDLTISKHCQIHTMLEGSTLKLNYMMMIITHQKMVPF